MKHNLLRKADIILIAACLIFALLLGIFLNISARTGSTVKISYDGREIYRIPLGAEEALYYLITYSEQPSRSGMIQEYGEERPTIPENVSYNLLQIEAGLVTMEAADCRDQICVDHKAISKNRENIICLPHKLAVEIIGSSSFLPDKKDSQELDGMAH